MSAEVLKYTREQVEALEVAPGFAHENLEAGFRVSRRRSTAPGPREGIRLSRRRDAHAQVGECVEAYIFNRHTGATLADSFVQYFTPSAPDKRKAGYADIARIEFTGKDRAAGKHWEDWVKNYNDKKAAGVKNIALVPEALD